MKRIWPLSMILALGLAPATGAFGQEKTQRLTVAIDETLSPVVEVRTSTMSLTGTAIGGAGVTRVTWQTSTGATGTAFGTGSWEAMGIPVAEGNTTIYVKAYDSKGASAWVALVAVRPAATLITSAAKPQPRPAL